MVTGPLLKDPMTSCHLTILYLSLKKRLQYRPDQVCKFLRTGIGRMDAIDDNVGIDDGRPGIDKHTIIADSRRIGDCLSKFCITIIHSRV